MPTPQNLPPQARDLLDRPEFATVATIEPDGRPHLSVIWLGRDGDDILFSTVRGRRKTDNLERDPRATVLVYPQANPYSYLEVRGSVTLEDDPDKALIEQMAHKYLGTPYPWHKDTERRVVVRLAADKVVWHG